MDGQLIARVIARELVHAHDYVIQAFCRMRRNYYAWQIRRENARFNVDNLVLIYTGTDATDATDATDSDIDSD